MITFSNFFYCCTLEGAPNFFVRASFSHVIPKKIFSLTVFSRRTTEKNRKNRAIRQGRSKKILIANVLDLI